MIEILEPIIENYKITYPILINKIRYEFYIKYNNINIELNKNIDGVVIMLISIAICNKWKITSKLSIDVELYNNLLKIPETYKKYHNKHTYLLGHIKKEEIDLILDLPTCKRINKNTKSITPISLGIDSIHTILTNKINLTHLIYINGLDLSYTTNNFNELLLSTANNFNLPLILAESNFKDLFYEIKGYGTNFSVFIGDAIMVSSCYPLGISNIYLSGFGGDIPCLMGQHSELNRYYKSNEFICFSNDTLRINKIKYIIDNYPELLNILRVCNEHTYLLNCSECSKCAETMCYFYMFNVKPSIFKYPNCDNYINLYIETYLNKKKLLFEKYDEKIFREFLNLYNNSLIFDIDKYKGSFINDDFVIEIKN
jgi:hypothetical protein